ncbi:Monocarboxylate transporter [Penicillium longicatenatum]|nr:Monocarboxylate transporter [Penicillium longicatenatum]
MVLIGIATVRERLPPRRRKILLPAAFTRAPFTLVTLGIFFMMWGLFTPFFYLPQYGQSLGMDPQLSSYILSTLNAGSVFGRILPGITADKIGRFNILSPPAHPLLTALLSEQSPAPKSSDQDEFAQAFAQAVKGDSKRKRAQYPEKYSPPQSQ